MQNVWVIVFVDPLKKLITENGTDFVECADSTVNKSVTFRQTADLLYTVTLLIIT